MGLARLAFRVLLTLLILLAVIGLVLPDSAHVEREIRIEAPVDVVFPHVNGMRAFHAWSPWTDVDPETRYIFEGPEQGAGSRMRWYSGDEGIGEGSQEITSATILRWQFSTDFGWDIFGRYVGLMLDSMIGVAYDKGLRTLKQRLEAESGSSA